MEAVRLSRPVRRLAAILVALSLVANGEDLNSWGNLESIAAGEALEVGKVTGGFLRGNYVEHSGQLIELSVNKQLVTLPRVQVSEIRLRARTGKGIWIGLAVGAAAGAGIGAGLGSRFEQSGDFGNATPVAAAILAGVGALVGLAIGSTLAHRHSVIYRAK